jgi:hypothetical protein
MRPSDVMEYLGCGKVQAWRLLQKLTPRRPTGPGGRPYYRRSEVDDLMEQSTGKLEKETA